MKIACLFLLLLLFVAPCAAQEMCDLRLKNSPMLFGLKLEMSPEEVQSIFGRDLKIKIKKKGKRVFFQNFIEKPAPNSLSGVRALYLRFFDRRLYQIEIFYEDKPGWKTLGDFTNDLSTKLNFPVSAWQIENGKAKVNCGELTIVADKILNPRIEITNETIRAKVEAIEAEKSKKN